MADFVITPGLISLGISAVTSVAKLYSSLTKLNSFQLLRNGLQSIRETQPGNIPTEESSREELVMDLLGKSEMISAGLKRRLISRFAMTLPILLACSLAISVNFASEDVLKIKGLESFDIMIFVFQLFIAFAGTAS